MEDSRKKPIMIAVIVICFAAAGIIWYATRPKVFGIDDIPDDQMIWLKCTNPDCGAEYQVNQKAYAKYIDEHYEPDSQESPLPPCEKCGQQTALRAEKCEKCELVFFRPFVPTDFADRCPECGYSATEEKKEEEAARRAAKE